jgi:tetratricopeptide (TPR) repeat protein
MAAPAEDAEVDEFEVPEYEEGEGESGGGAVNLARGAIAPCPPPSLSPSARPDGKAQSEEPRSAIFETRLDAAASHRAAGNELFKAGRWADARASYERGLHQAGFDEVQYNFELLDQHRALVDAVRIPLWLNVAACSLKLGAAELEDAKASSRRAIESCSEVLKLEPNNVKALFRRGQAYQLGSRLENARADLVKAAHLEPTDVLIRRALTAVVEELRAEQAEQRSLWEGKLSPPPLSSPVQGEISDLASDGSPNLNLPAARTPLAQPVPPQPKAHSRRPDSKDEPLDTPPTQRHALSANPCAQLMTWFFGLLIVGGSSINSDNGSNNNSSTNSSSSSTSTNINSGSNSSSTRVDKVKTL